MAQRDETGGAGQPFRRSSDRDPFINTGDGSPTSATAIRNIALAMFEAGYDGRDLEDMRQLASDLRYHRERMAKDREKQNSSKALRVIIFSSILTGIVGIAAQWLGPLLHFLFGSHVGQGGK